LYLVVSISSVTTIKVELLKKTSLQILNAPWYWATFAAYPVLALLAHNISQVRWTAGIRPLGLSLLAAALFFLLFRVIYRDWHRAAFAITALILLFFTYGQVYDQLSQKKVPHLALWLGGAWLLLAVLALAWSGRRKTRFQGAALVLNVISLGLVVYAAYMVIAEIPHATRSNVPADPKASVRPLHLPAGETPPDIYYFILDSYGRTDLLKNNLEYDNSGFIANLEKQGFYVAQCSQSNYPRTDVSLGSSLNMDYLQNLNPKFTPQNEDRTQLWQSILNSDVADELKSAGYKTVAFATGFAFTEITSADVYITPSPVWSPITEFEVLVLRTTPLRHLQDLGWVNLEQIDGQRYRERTLLALNSMSRLAHMQGPKFAFIHLVIPHPPFVFLPDGSPDDPSKYMDENGIYSQEHYYKGYRQQADFISAQIEKAAATLISESAHPPVIVIQGDHSPWLQNGSDEFKILNAYYLPGHNDLLYPSISPVNTFRLILDTYFGADYPLLKDESFYSPIPKVFNFSEAPDTCP
jgi:Sulfatase